MTSSETPEFGQRGRVPRRRRYRSLDRGTGRWNAALALAVGVCVVVPTIAIVQSTF